MNVPVEVVVTVRVEHVRVCTATPFSEVVRHIEAACGVFDGDRIKELVTAGAPASAILEEVATMAGESGFMRFATFDHGLVLRLEGHSAEAAVRYPHR